MSKKAFIETIAVSLIVTVIVGAEYFQLVGANPVPTAKPTTPPNIVIMSPQDRIYHQNYIPLNFTVDFTPGFFASLVAVYYRLDEGPLVFLSTEGPYFTNLTGVNRGKHFLTVYADVEGRYYPNYPNSTVTDGFSLEGTKSTWFTVVTELESASPTISPSYTPSASPSPTLPRPTPSLPYPPSPSLTLSPSESPTQTPTLQPSPTPNRREDNFALLAIVAGLVVAVVVVGLLVYLAKHKGLK